MFEYEAYTNPDRDLNKLYWDLYERYVMLPRHDDMRAWAAVTHFTTHPIYLQNYLFADIIAAQTLAYLHRGGLNLAFDNSAGAFLVQDYLRFGGRYRWKELLERGTGEPFNPERYLSQMGL
jgi:peptidyl-dipeptidase A